MRKGDPIKRTSKYLSKILRHAPGSIGLELDKAGWGSLGDLIRLSPPWVTPERVEAAVEQNDKQRFTIEDGRIRANQGHSIEVDLGLKIETPPEFLYHGTFAKAVNSIWRDGLLKMNRHAVHMASETTTAATVGRRSGTPVGFKILAAQMHTNGFDFYVSANGVWLTDQVPPRYLERLP
jgi:putative RNA 2'-phosphotransferase